ncbi:hypothetical protein M9458_008732, partial [Cirrhinus mrigala]
LSSRREPSLAFPRVLAPLPPRRSGRYTLGVRRWTCWRGWRRVTPLSPPLPGRSAARSEGSEARTAATSSQGTGSSLHLSSSEEGDLESTAEEASPQSVQYEELLEVVTRAVAKLNIDWPAEEKAAPQKAFIQPASLQSGFFLGGPANHHLQEGAFLSSPTSMLRSRGRGKDHIRLACSSPPLTTMGT